MVIFHSKMLVHQRVFHQVWCLKSPGFSEAQCLLLCAKSELRNPMVAEKVRLEAT